MNITRNSLAVFLWSLNSADILDGKPGKKNRFAIFIVEETHCSVWYSFSWAVISAQYKSLWECYSFDYVLMWRYITLVWVLLAVLPHVTLSVNCSKKHSSRRCKNWEILKLNFKYFVITESVCTDFNASFTWLISLFCSGWTDRILRVLFSSSLLRTADYTLVSTLEAHFGYAQSVSGRYKH